MDELDILSSQNPLRYTGVFAKPGTEQEEKLSEFAAGELLSFISILRYLLMLVFPSCDFLLNYLDYLMNFVYICGKYYNIFLVNIIPSNSIDYMPFTYLVYYVIIYLPHLRVL